MTDFIANYSKQAFGVGTSILDTNATCAFNNLSYLT